MNNRTKLLLSVFIFLGLFPAFLFAAPVRMVISTDDTSGFPYITGEGVNINKEMPGIEIELYQRVAGMLDIELRIERRSWNKCLKDLGNNVIDGIFPASFKKKRMKLGHYPMKDGKVDTSKKTRDNTYYLYMLKNSKVEWDGVKFKNLKKPIGATKGWAIVDTLKKMGVQVEESGRPKYDLNKILKGRIDGAASLETVMDELLENSGIKYKRIAKYPIPLRKKEYFLVLSKAFFKKHPNLSQDIWDKIEEVKKSQWFKDAFRRYQGS